MPREDALRWNARYQSSESGEYANFLEPRPFLVQNAHLLPPTGVVLDIAMGLGGNAGFLIHQGFSVVGVDISDVAVRRSRINMPGLMGVIADLKDCLLFAPQAFDVILNFYYLERSLWPEYRRLLRPGGLLFFETLTQDMRQNRADIDPKYLLRPGELSEAFQGWDILAYREGWEPARSHSEKATASLIARIA